MKVKRTRPHLILATMEATIIFLSLVCLFEMLAQDGSYKNEQTSDISPTISLPDSRQTHYRICPKLCIWMLIKSAPFINYYFLSENKTTVDFSNSSSTDIYRTLKKYEKKAMFLRSDLARISMTIYKATFLVSKISGLKYPFFLVND